MSDDATYPSLNDKIVSLTGGAGGRPPKAVPNTWAGNACPILWSRFTSHV